MYCFYGNALSAYEVAAPHVYRERTLVNVVEIPVYVTKSGTPIKNLT